MFGKDVENFPDFQRLSIFSYKISATKVTVKNKTVNTKYLFFSQQFRKIKAKNSV
jgi:hypothetical protein